jgi:hypothetical protein
MSCLAAFSFSRGAKVPSGYRENTRKIVAFYGAKEKVSEKSGALKKRSSPCRCFGFIETCSFGPSVLTALKEERSNFSMS